MTTPITAIIAGKETSQIKATAASRDKKVCLNRSMDKMFICHGSHHTTLSTHRVVSLNGQVIPGPLHEPAARSAPRDTGQGMGSSGYRCARWLAYHGKLATGEYCACATEMPEPGNVRRGSRQE
ncbi:hypothetical protein RRG08_029825 [Elysia crispata]|uniref:Uncharacterized protein n=1 Tax=Elysia crispata TaxID=231223 RepID=A0AAE0YLY1_9GAST|nr:hypothetical protein RRG08_029825 [Elysia crispata]